MRVGRLNTASGCLAGVPVLIVLLYGSAAAAQAPGLDERRIEFTASVSAVYDSNVARGSQSVADARGIRRGEFTYSPNGNANIVLPFGRQTVFLSGDVGYEFHQYNSKLQRERIGLTGGVQRPVGPCVGGVNGGFSRSQTDLADLSLIVTENTQQTVTVAGSVSCMPLAGVGVSVGLQHGDTRNTAEMGVVNSSQDAVNAGLNYTNRLIGTLSLTGTYSTSDYGDPGVPDQFVPSGFETTGLSLGIQRPIGTRLTGSASLGYTRLRSKSGTSGFDGLTGTGALNYRVNPRVSAQLAYRRSVNSSLLQGADYALSESLSLRASYRIGSRISTSLGGQVTRGSQRGQIAAVPGTALNSRSKSVFGSVSVPIGRSSNLSFNANYEVRNANPTLFDYSSYRLGVTASTSF